VLVTPAARLMNTARCPVAGTTLLSELMYKGGDEHDVIELLGGGGGDSLWLYISWVARAVQCAVDGPQHHQ
jgi:hypothetical protein